MRPTISKAPTLRLQTVTWEKESHGLFDYEATKLIREFFEIQGPCKLFRNWASTQTSIISNDKIKKGQLPDSSFTFISSITLRHNGNNDQFVLSAPEKPSQDIMRVEDRDNADQKLPINTNAYIIVRYFKGSSNQNGYPLMPGTVLKLGRVEFKVVQMGGLPRRKHLNKDDIFFGEFNGVYQATEKITGTCKFCLGEDNKDDNILISPCNCKGSCEGVHINCLKTWIDSKVKKEVNGVVVSYNFTKFECELCKEPFPRVVATDKMRMEMITIEKPTKPYIILEGINQRKESKEERCLHVISLEDDSEIKMGRGHQCEIRLQDISVSRMHSIIKHVQGDFYITDQNSKFGTLIRMDNPLELNSKAKLQIGRTIYEFEHQ